MVEVSSTIRFDYIDLMVLEMFNPKVMYWTKFICKNKYGKHPEISIDWLHFQQKLSNYLPRQQYKLDSEIYQWKLEVS